jgi:hypothetical protein
MLIYLKNVIILWTAIRKLQLQSTRLKNKIGTYEIIIFMLIVKGTWEWYIINMKCVDIYLRIIIMLIPNKYSIVYTHTHFTEELLYYSSHCER